jgi:hypothetical protein
MVEQEVTHPPCLSCGQQLQQTFVDLGMSPLANSYVSAKQAGQHELFFPLHTRVCLHCFLVQLEPVARPEDIFSDYAYFSSFSDMWLDHARTYTEKVAERFALNSQSWVVEIASNDGYLLQYFVPKGIPVLGIEPAANIAQEAIRRGIPTEVMFFGENAAQRLVSRGKQADLIIGNNVFAHVPDLNGFVAGLKILLGKNGAITLEFPHLVQLMQHNQFDTIYHEHVSYFSLTAAANLFTRHQLTVFDVEELPTHGGSLRVYVCHQEDRQKPATAAVRDLLAREEKAGLRSLGAYLAFDEQVKSTDFLDYTVDRSPHKQGRLLPGTHIPIYPPEKIRETKPDFVLILPWNLKDEVMEQMSFVREWGGKFVVPIPSVQIYS